MGLFRAGIARLSPSAGVGMSDNREILRTTFLKGMVPARVRNQDAVDTWHATIGELQKRCGTEVASLFAEPVRPTKPDPDNPQMTWFTPLDGQMLDLATIDEVARRPVSSCTRSSRDVAPKSQT
jgi:hypothetical protein